MPDNHAPYIDDNTMRSYDELTQLGQRQRDGDNAQGAVTAYGNQAWGAGHSTGLDATRGDYALSMAAGGLGGGLLGLVHEALRHKTEREKNQTTGGKLMRYAGKGGLGALAGAGAGGLYQAAMHKLSNMAPNDDDDQENDNKTYRKTAEPTHMSNTHNTPEQPILTGTLAQKAAQVLAALNEKQADLTGAGLGAGVWGGLGALAGAPIGGMYGLASGAYQGGKGKRLSGALRGMGRGMLGGGLIGAGAGAGFGGTIGAAIPMGDLIKELKNRPYANYAPDSENSGVSIGARHGLAAIHDMGPVVHNLVRGLGVAGAGAGGYYGHKAFKGVAGDFNKKKPVEKEEEENKDTKAAASEWKGVDLAKNPINWSRTLPKADASSKNWQGVPGQKPAAPAVAPVNQAPPMAPVLGKVAHLRNFGAKVAGFNIGDLAKHIPEGLKKVMPAAGAGALGGAALGGVAGLIAPGHEDSYDDEGNVVGRKQRGRFGAMMRGALGGGAAGGLAGGALEHFRPGTMGQAQSGLNNLRQMYNGKQSPDRKPQSAEALNEAYGEEPQQPNPAMQFTGPGTERHLARMLAPSTMMPPEWRAPSAAEARLQQQLGQESAVQNAHRQMGILPQN